MNKIEDKSKSKEGSVFEGGSSRGKLLNETSGVFPIRATCQSLSHKNFVKTVDPENDHKCKLQLFLVHHQNCLKAAPQNNNLDGNTN